jgi:hypothetical protein
MNRRIAGTLALAVVSSLALVASLYSQAKKDPQTGLYRIEGSVTAIDKEKAVITVKEASSANVTWSVAYLPETVFTAHNKDAKLDAVMVGAQVICIGKIPDPDKAKTHLSATRIDVRSK